jgi:TonB family protein
MLPKLPVAIISSNSCSEFEKSSFFAFADQAVYELTLVAKTRRPIPVQCPSKKTFGENALADRLVELRNGEAAEAAEFRDGRQVYRFSGEAGQRLIIPDLKKNRWVELATIRRADSGEDDKFFGSLDLEGTEGKDIGAGSPTTLGDPGVRSEPAPPEATDRSKVEPLRVVAKPKASYTDSARRAGVQGNVTVKVTFLANGSIGDVTVLKPLPNGLTEQAVGAARKLVFLPARLGGRPIDKTMTVQYGFSIY